MKALTAQLLKFAEKLLLHQGWIDVSAHQSWRIKHQAQSNPLRKCDTLHICLSTKYIKRYMPNDILLWISIDSREAIGSTKMEELKRQWWLILTSTIFVSDSKIEIPLCRKCHLVKKDMSYIWELWECKRGLWYYNIGKYTVTTGIFDFLKKWSLSSLPL